MEPETYTTVTSGNTVTDGTAVFTAYSVKAAIIDGKAPKSHASTATTYGVGNASRYGHVKLSDDYNTISASQKAANGVGASAWALQTVRSFIGTLSNLLTDAKTNLVAAINEVDGHADAAQASANIVQAQVSNSDDAYDPTTPYEVGNLCIYNNMIHRCITPCSAGSWATNQSCFTADTLTNLMSTLVVVKHINLGFANGFVDLPELSGYVVAQAYILSNWWVARMNFDGTTTRAAGTSYDGSQQIPDGFYVVKIIYIKG